jgi:hypothetical protein
MPSAVDLVVAGIADGDGVSDGAAGLASGNALGDDDRLYTEDELEAELQSLDALMPVSAAGSGAESKAER